MTSLSTGQSKRRGVAMEPPSIMAYKTHSQTLSGHSLNKRNTTLTLKRDAESVTPMIRVMTTLNCGRSATPCDWYFHTESRFDSEAGR
jgi:hypothetical protein